jgi:hypothetical protein
VLKLEDDEVALVATASATGKPDKRCAYVRLDTMVEALRLAGYEVSKR